MVFFQKGFQALPYGVFSRENKPCIHDGISEPEQVIIQEKEFSRRILTNLELDESATDFEKLP